MIVRPESPRDVDAIRRVNIEAFRDHPFSQQTEHLIVEALRAADALDISLVAELDGSVVGHIAFSQAQIGDEASGWYLLGPGGGPGTGLRCSVCPQGQTRTGVRVWEASEGVSRWRGPRAASQPGSRDRRGGPWAHLRDSLSAGRDGEERLVDTGLTRPGAPCLRGASSTRRVRPGQTSPVVGSLADGADTVPG
jgi:hypothetical protein